MAFLPFHPVHLAVPQPSAAAKCGWSGTLSDCNEISQGAWTTPAGDCHQFLEAWVSASIGDPADILFNFIESSDIKDSIRELLWYPIEANARKTLTTSAYSRVMELSRDYHDNKKSGELYKSIEQGTAVCQLLETVFFKVVPIITDLLVACGYLAYLFGGFMALTVGASVLFFLTLSKYIIIKQVDIFREHAAAERQENQTLLDSVGGWVSVAYFNNFHYELTRYSAAIDKTIQTYWRGFAFNHVWRLSNDMILQVGFVGACFVATYQVSIGRSSIGSFVLLLNYWGRFTGKYFIHRYTTLC